MAEPKASEGRSYHHGDLRRALMDAARRLLETEGVAALSLRAVAREAGVSPAAPYHHFKEKGDLLAAVADEGWSRVGAAMAAAQEAAAAGDQLTAVVLAYVRFAREQPALYQVMFEAARVKASLPTLRAHAGEASAYSRVREALVAAEASISELDVDLSIAAAWCSAHGLAEMAGFPQFERLKQTVGGEQPFFKAMLRHIGLYRIPPGR